MITQATSLEDLQKDHPVVVCFTNPFTCNPCTMFKPHFENAAKSVDGVEFMEVDATDPAHRPIVDEYLERFLTPTVILIKGSERINVEARTTIPLINEINGLV